MGANKLVTIILEINGQDVSEAKVRLTKKHLEDYRNMLYYRYALKNKDYKIHIKIPSKKEDSNRNYLTLNLNLLNFKPSNNDTSTEQ